jgi:hypothetical protein
VSRAIWPSSIEKSTWQPCPLAARPCNPASIAIAAHSPEVHRRAAALAGQAHDAAHGLEDGVVAATLRKRAGLPEAGAGHVDDARVDGADRRIVEAVALERADREILQENVGAARQRADDVLALFGAQVDGDRLFRTVEREVVSAFVAAVPLDERLEGAGLVAAPRLLDLDHGRAQLGQDHAGERAGQHPREIEDRDVLQRLHRGS